jgi:hypothetical protein
MKHLALLIVAVLLLPGTAHADTQREAIVRVIAGRAVHYGINPEELIDLASCETGGTFNNRLVGKQGERGPFQFHPRGKLRHFHAVGYSDPEDWFESADYTAWILSLGGGGAWSCYKG